ncbi:hypothetical protein C8F04DRAFT_1188039 [Mycena alexandri]|uniref:Uncharacterized protein n=1 Tax=Mycena alexandri TaxID=1745969 RepID=A0AAD6WZC6_9AGAR|nr:hypothetical protein C8F04DRAFT_1188039 [Mycena alexandri]
MTTMQGTSALRRVFAVLDAFKKVRIELLWPALCCGTKKHKKNAFIPLAAVADIKPCAWSPPQDYRSSLAPVTAPALAGNQNPPAEVQTENKLGIKSPHLIHFANAAAEAMSTRGSIIRLPSTASTDSSVIVGFVGQGAGRDDMTNGQPHAFDRGPLRATDVINRPPRAPKSAPSEAQKRRHVTVDENGDATQDPPAKRPKLVTGRGARTVKAGPMPQSPPRLPPRAAKSTQDL